MTVQPMAFDMNLLRPAQPTSPQIANAKKEDSFSSVLDKSREKQEEPIKSKKYNDNNKDKQVSNDKPKVEAKKSDIEKPVTSKEPTNKDATSKSGEVKESTVEEEALLKKQVDLAMAAVADLLGITVIDLDQMLSAMQMGLSDLLKGDNLQQLIMEVNGTQEPMDLLLIPELATNMKKVTAVIEDYAQNLTQLGFDVNLVEAQEVKAEVVIKPETQGVNLANQKVAQQDPKLEVSNEKPEVGTELVETANNVLAQSAQGLTQNEEQATPGQEDAGNQFLDNLSQSMGEVFRAQANQVNETFEAVAARTEAVNPRMVLDQIVEKIKVITLDNESKMSIQLKPEHLGKVNMEIISKQGIMTAHIMVENEKTRALLEQNIQSLRESLESKGLVIQELEVAVGQNQNQDGPAYQGQKSNKNVSDIISRMMNEDMVEEVETKPDNLFDTDNNEVDFIA